MKKSFVNTLVVLTVVALGAGGETAFGMIAVGATSLTGSVPAGTGEPSGTRADGVPIVSGGLGPIAISDTAVLASVAAETGAIVSAIMAEPTTVLARAVGVLITRAVEAIGVDPVVTAFAALGAGAPASLFWGGTGLSESRIFCAAA